ncbi:hypothetical protein D3C75_463810 [compost metagenome]
MGYHLSDHYIQVESIESIKHFSEKKLTKKGWGISENETFYIRVTTFNLASNPFDYYSTMDINICW